jgi:hypothetical protein
MRGLDQTLGQAVMWIAPEVDPTGVHYDGPGPVVDIVVQTLPGRKKA